jgi:leucyl-tRNA synthetase
VDESLLVEDEVEIPVQVQGKVRGKILVATDLPDAEVQAKALADANVARHLEGKTVRKVIVIPGKMVNIVAG